MTETLPPLEIRVADCDIECLVLIGAENLDLDDSDVARHVIAELRDTIAVAVAEQTRYAEWLRDHDQS